MRSSKSSFFASSAAVVALSVGGIGACQLISGLDDLKPHGAGGSGGGEGAAGGGGTGGVPSGGGGAGPGGAGGGGAAAGGGGAGGGGGCTDMMTESQCPEGGAGGAAQGCLGFCDESGDERDVCRIGCVTLTAECIPGRQDVLCYETLAEGMPHLDCEILCNANDTDPMDANPPQGGCVDKTIECPQNGNPCTIMCFNGGCVDADIICGNGPCTLICGPEGGCSPDTTITCGPGRCEVTCEMSRGPAELQMGDTPSCDPVPIPAMCTQGP